MKTPGEIAKDLEAYRASQDGIILGINMRRAYQALSPKDREFFLLHENMHRELEGLPPLTDADFGIGNDNGTD